MLWQDYYSKIKDKAHIDFLRLLKKKHKRTPTTKDLTDAGMQNYRYYYTRWGSLQEAQRLAGCEPNQSDNPEFQR